LVYNTDKEFFMNKQVKNSVNPLSVLIDEHRMSLAIYSLVILTATGWTLSITTCMFLLAWQLLTETVATENGYWERQLETFNLSNTRLTSLSKLQDTPSRKEVP